MVRHQRVRNGSGPHAITQLPSARREIQVIAVLPPRVSLLDLGGPLDVLRRANIEQKAVYFRVRCVGVTRSISTSIGLDLHTIEPLPESLPDDAIVMVFGSVDNPTNWGRPKDHGGDGEDQAVIVRWLENNIRPTHTLVGICSGTLFFGHAGLLDGRSCTTHHADCAGLARIAPKARVLEDRLFVQDGNIYTSAGITAGVDLMLYFVGRLLGPACTVAIARHLVVYIRRTGSDPQVSPWLEGRNHIHPAVHRVQDAIAANPSRAWNRVQLAQIAGASIRHLSRLFHKQVGMSIVDYRNRLRVALAREFLLQSELDMENIAERAGFSSTRQLRRAWQRVYPGSPSEARTAAAELSSASAA
ncbi:MAG TPA: helix-turn-helix domain-containing protein [Acidobacteriaceae bacterium]|nr:helix-turn-helix domain-containing protein [Acidobacteriaceae bacterium]